MNGSCSTRLDWEYRRRGNFRRTIFLLFIVFGVLLCFLATFCWMAVTSDSFVKSLYWTVQTVTTVGYGAGFDGWGSPEFAMCLVWMTIAWVYYACLLSIVVSKVAEFFEH